MPDVRIRLIDENRGDIRPHRCPLGRLNGIDRDFPELDDSDIGASWGRARSLPGLPGSLHGRIRMLGGLRGVSGNRTVLALANRCLSSGLPARCTGAQGVGTDAADLIAAHRREDSAGTRSAHRPVSVAA